MGTTRDPQLATHDAEHHRSRLPGITLLVVGVLALLLIGWWVRQQPSGEWTERVPAPTDRSSSGEAETQPAMSLGVLTQHGVEAPDLPGSWPRFRGPDGNAISPESIPLAREWPESGPPKLWELEVGEGYAGAAILRGRVYLLDYDSESQSDTIRCLSLATGEEIWRYAYPVKVKRNHGMSRTVPAVTHDYVVTLGPKCHVACLDARTGEFQWGIDLVAEYGSKVPPWYAGQCPLIDGDTLILAPAGDVLMLAADLKTGEILWTAPNPRRWKMTHSSIVPMTFDGERMYVYCGSGGVAGVSADDGTLLWDTTDWKISIATIVSPLPLPDERIFLSGGYNAGAMMLQLHRAPDGFATETLFRLPAETFGATQQTPIFYEGYIYGVRPDGQFVCLNLEGEVQWTSGAANQFGIGPFLLASGMVFLLDDDGTLTLLEATPEEYRPLAQAQVLHGHDAWGPIAIAGGRLIARDLTQMICLDMKG